MTTFRISTHGRLQDWIAAENGYFAEEGLDYELDVRPQETRRRRSSPPGTTCGWGRMSCTARRGRQEEHELRLSLGGQPGRG